MRVKDRDFEVFISKEEIEKIVKGLAQRIGKDYEGRNPLFVVMLNGSFVFAADLLRNLRFPCETTFVRLSSYEGDKSTGTVKQLIGLNEDVSGRTVVIVEDIIESGTTMKEMLHILDEKQPKDVRIASLFVKPGCLKVSLNIDYRCFDIENDFIVGYGLDYNQEGRNLPHIYQVVE